jgi:uncharacterized protein
MRGLPKGLWLAFFLIPLTMSGQADPRDPLSYPGPAWSPYLVGAGIGFLACLTLWRVRKTFGASGGYATLAGLAGGVVAPKKTRQLSYFKANPPHSNWGLMLLLGLPMGAFLGAFTGGETTGRWLPPLWVAHFGENSFWWRMLFGFLGGTLMAVGARLAGGCTSGHGISGTLQLSLGSWIAVVCFFIGGVATAAVLYRL